MQLKNPLQRFNLVFWQPLVAYFVSLLVCFGFIGYRLGTLVPGFSAQEIQSIKNSISLKQIFDNPVFAPHEILQYIAHKSGHHGYIAMRLPSVIIAVACIILFFYIVNRWFQFKIAMISSILLLTSSWLLHTARVATPDITMLGLLAGLAYAIWLPAFKKPLVALFLGAVVLSTSLYIPGFIWFVLVGLLWQRKNLYAVYKEAKVPAIFTLCACLIVLTPLFISLAGSTILIKQYLGLPLDLTNALVQLPKNLLLIPYHLVLRGPINPAMNLGRVPLLDFFTAVFATLGAISYVRHRHLKRSQLLLASLILGSVLTALGGTVTIAILMPFIFLLVAGGLNFMVEQWSKVFPLNPFAHGLTNVLLAAAVLVSIFYNVNNYFIAWPQTPATKIVYSKQPFQP